MDLARRLDEVLQVGTNKEVSEIDKLAVALVLHIDDAPSILTTTHLPAIDDNGFLASNHGKWDDILDGGVGGTFLIVELLVIVWIHPYVVE